MDPAELAVAAHILLCLPPAAMIPLCPTQRLLGRPLSRYSCRLVSISSPRRYLFHQGESLSERKSISLTYTMVRPRIMELRGSSPIIPIALRLGRQCSIWGIIAISVVLRFMGIIRARHWQYQLMA